VKDSGFAGFIRYRQAVLMLEAGNFSHGLGPAIDKAQEFEIELVDCAALLSKGLAHGDSLLWNKNTKAAICGSRPGEEIVCEF
jgi:hypothetical protein